MKKQYNDSRIVTVWQGGTLVLHAVILGLALIGSCFASDDPFAGVHTNASVRQTRGSYEQMAQERGRVDELRSALGSSRYHDRPHWAPAYTLPALKTVGGGIVAGTLAAVLSNSFKAPELVPDPAVSAPLSEGKVELPRSRTPFNDIPGHIWLAGTTAGTVGAYQLAALIARQIMAHRQRKKIESFIALWPGYRHLASDEVKALMNTVHQEFSSTGTSDIPYAQHLKMYNMLAHTLAHQRRQLTEQMDSFKRSKRRAEREKKKQLEKHRRGA